MIGAVAVVGWVIAGAASAFGGWCFHKVVKLKAQVDDVEKRVEKLSK